jgi:arsenite methyltransferase
MTTSTASTTNTATPVSTGDTSTTVVAETPNNAEALRAQVRSRYGAIAKRVSESAEAVESGESDADSCCEPTCCPEDASEATSAVAAAAALAPSEAVAPRTEDPITSNLYSDDEALGLPEEALLASLGCGNPTALAELHPGETVLDLGSGGGIDVLLSARRVGPTGFAFGLDMTDEMLALANANKAKAGAKNVTFLKGTIEEIPLPSNSVDVIISNCVINLSADKGAVLREAFRVLKPGGRLAVSDVVVQGSLPAALRQSMELWAGCIGGALEEDTYRSLLAESGFGDIGVQVTRVYDADSLASASDDDSCCGPSGDDQLAAFQEFTTAGGQLVSAFVRAAKPASA